VACGETKTKEVESGIVGSGHKRQKKISSAEPIIPGYVTLTQALHALYGSCRFFNDRPPSAFGFGRNDIYDQFGPNLGLCLKELSWPRGLEADKAAVHSALMRVTPQSLRDMIEEAEDCEYGGHRGEIIPDQAFRYTQSRIHGLCDAHLGPHRV